MTTVVYLSNLVLQTAGSLASPVFQGLVEVTYLTLLEAKCTYVPCIHQGENTELTLIPHRLGSSTYTFLICHCLVIHSNSQVGSFLFELLPLYLRDDY